MWRQRQHHDVVTQTGAAAEQLAAAPRLHPVCPRAHHLQETGGGLATEDDAEGKAVAKDATVVMERSATVETIAMTVETQT